MGDFFSVTKAENITYYEFQRFTHKNCIINFDAPQQIPETLYFSLRCVECLLGKGLGYVLDVFFGDEYTVF
jgi:hypothetical protein